MLNAAGLAFIVAGSRWGEADGQIMFILILTLAAAEVSVGLGAPPPTLSSPRNARRRRGKQYARIRCLLFSRSFPLCRSLGFVVLFVTAGVAAEAMDCGRRRRLRRHLDSAGADRGNRLPGGAEALHAKWSGRWIAVGGFDAGHRLLSRCAVGGDDAGRHVRRASSSISTPPSSWAMTKATAASSPT